MMEDHNRLLAAPESGSGPVNDAMRRRSALALGCVLVALGVLFCVGKESQAKPPALAPEPGGSAASHGPASQDAPHAPIAEERAPVVRREPVARGPVSSPAQQPDARTVPDQRPTTETPGGQVAPQGTTVQEPTGVREQGPPKPVGPDPARPSPPQPEERPAVRDMQGRNAEVPTRPVAEQGKPAQELRGPGGQGRPQEPLGSGAVRPENANKDTSSRPVREQPGPKTDPRASEDTGPQEGAGTPDQHSKPEIPPGKENVPPEGKSSPGPSEQSQQPPENDVAAGPEPDKTAGNSTHKPEAPGKESPLVGHPEHTGAATNAPDGGPTSAGSVGMETPDRRSPVRTFSADETASGVRQGAEPSQPRTGISGLSREEPARVAGSSPAPERQAVESSRADVPYAPPGGDQRPAGVQAQVASGTPLGSAKFLSDPLWEERGSLVDMTPEVLRAGPVDPHAVPKSAFFGDSITPRGPPLDVPSPFFGFVPMMGGAATGTAGSSGTGTAPLLAIVASCLIALLYRGRSRIACNFLPPRTVPQPALERPG
jgi:hypothetical protein